MKKNTWMLLPLIAGVALILAACTGIPVQPAQQPAAQPAAEEPAAEEPAAEEPAAEEEAMAEELEVDALVGVGHEEVDQGEQEHQKQKPLEDPHRATSFPRTSSVRDVTQEGRVAVPVDPNPHILPDGQIMTRDDDLAIVGRAHPPGILRPASASRASVV